MSVVFTPTPTNETNAAEFDDGDAPSASIINPLGEAAFNTAKWAANRVGNYRLVQMLSLLKVGATQQGLDYTSTAFGTNDYALYTLYDLKAGDVLIVDAHFHAMSATIHSFGEFRLAAKEAGAGSPTEMTGARVSFVCGNYTNAEDGVYPLSCKGVRVVSAAGTAVVYLQGRLVAGTGSPAIRLYNPATYIIEVWRDNS
jgi:hypothetical protein